MSKVSRTLVVAPHPDDEILGVGGTLLRRKAEGGVIGCVYVTAMTEAGGWSKEDIARRDKEISAVARRLGLDAIFQLDYPAAQLDRVAMRDLVGDISQIIKEFSPDEVFVSHWSDVHGDHRIVYDAVAGSTKWFRQNSVRRLLAYETLSETEFSVMSGQRFNPNVFIDITPYLEDKLVALGEYQSELDNFPFPRSVEAIRSLAKLRGSSTGVNAAEAFELLRERS